MEVGRISGLIRRSDYRFSDHVVKRLIQRNISRSEIEQAISNGMIIEEYPDDKYSPSCLIYGKTNHGRDLHIQLSLPPDIVIITTYEPDSDEWIDCVERKK